MCRKCPITNWNHHQPCEINVEQRKVKSGPHCCTHIRTTLSPLDLWTDPAGVTALLARWTEKLAGGPQAGTSDSPHQQGSWEWVDNNSREKLPNKKECGTSTTLVCSRHDILSTKYICNIYLIVIGKLWNLICFMVNKANNYIEPIGINTFMSHAG